MTDLAKQMAAHREAITAVRMMSAVLCVEAAERGVFHKPGVRCRQCEHAAPDGCTLRLRE